MGAVVHRLAADEFTGRRVGTPGGRAAAAWLATHLESLGAQVHTDTFMVAGVVKELTATPTLRWASRDLVHRRDFAEHLASAYTPHPVQGVWAVAESVTAAPAGAVGIVLPRGVDDTGRMPKMIAGPAASSLPVVSVRTQLYRQMKEDPPMIMATVPLRTVDVTGTNVHAIFRAAAPGQMSVLLTAHLDGVGDDPGLRFPAAADNASGVAAIIEAAQRLHHFLPPGVGLAVAGRHRHRHGVARLPDPDRNARAG